MLCSGQRTAPGHFSCHFSIFACLFFFNMFLFSCPQISPHAAGRASPGRAARDGVQDDVPSGDLALDQSWKQPRPQTFLGPAGEKKKKAISAACDLQVPRGPRQPACHTATFTPSVRVIKGYSNEGMSQPLKMQVQRIFFKDLALLFIFCL